MIETALLQKVHETIEKHDIFASGDTVVIGVSGGPDSLTLLHVLRSLRQKHGLTLYVAHLNHQLRADAADADAAFVARTAEEWGVPATVRSVDVAAYAESNSLAIEEGAREARYAFLAQVAERVGAEKVAVGHHADDQVETVIMHWLRGAGLAGLRGMQPVSRFPRYPRAMPPLETSDDPELYRPHLVRPLLEVTRPEIEDYCQQLGLQPRFDRSNLDTTMFRNRLRHVLLPYLESYNPNIREVVRRSAKVIAGDYVYLRQQVEEAWEEVITENDEAFVFDLQSWSDLHVSLQRGLVREAVRRLRQELRDISFVHVEDALEIANEKPAGSVATLPGALQLFKSYETFTIGEELPEPEVPLLETCRLPLRIPGLTQLPESDWRLEAQIFSSQKKRGGLFDENQWRAVLDYERIGSDPFLRTREPGDRFQPLGMEGHSKSVSEFMINEKVPSHLRDRWPLVASPDSILWIVGLRLDDRMKVRKSTEQVLELEFRKSNG